MSLRRETDPQGRWKHYRLISLQFGGLRRRPENQELSRGPWAEVNIAPTLECGKVLELSTEGSCFATLERLCSSPENLHCQFIYSRCLLKQTFLLYTIQILWKIANISWSFGHATEGYTIFCNGLWARGKNWYRSQAKGWRVMKTGFCRHCHETNFQRKGESWNCALNQLN